MTLFASSLPDSTASVVSQSARRIRPLFGGRSMLLLAGVLVAFSVTASRVATAIQDGPDKTANSTKHFYVLDMDDLEWDFSPSYFGIQSTIPYAYLDGDSKVWFCPKGAGTRFDFELAIQSDQPLEKISGLVYLPEGRKKELKEIPFRAKSVTSASRTTFFSALENHYRYLLRQDVSGKVWFRHRLQQAIREQGKPASAIRDVNRRFRNEMDRTFDLFSGSRAIAENIQLDRELLNIDDGDFSIDVASIEGITIKEFDWKPHLKKEVPLMDELAGFIPHDQHVIFFRSASAITQLMGEVSSLVIPSWGAFSVSSVDRQVIPGYFRQLAIDLEQFGEAGLEVDSVAVTGSDPFSELGTDIGVWIQLKDEDNARKFTAMYAKQINSQGSLDELPDSGWNKTDDRVLSAYYFRVGKRVAIANSKHQILQLRSAAQNQVSTLKELEEYRFFRQRYELADDETAFVFMSDAAIRRWCGPRWRVGQSRRLRALAMLQQIHAEQMMTCLELAPGETREIKLGGNRTKTLGKVFASREGVYSSRFGSIKFMTPIAELEVTKVSESEKASYDRWRNNYQRNWSQAFDPIGMQLKLTEKKIEADLSVIPLILSSSYRSLTNGRPFESWSGDLHRGTLLHMIAAPGLEQIVEPYLKGLHFIEVFADDDREFWRDFTDEQEAQKYFEDNLQKLPVCLAFHFDNAERLQHALDSTKMFIERNIEKETDVKYRGKTYRRMEFETDFIIGGGNKLDLFVHKSDNHVYFSLSEALIKRVIERKVSKPKSDSIRPWLGKHLAIQLNQRFFRALEGMAADQIRQTVRRQSWSNLPILNEWNRLYPNQNPLEIQAQYWGEKLVCAGGGKYRWDPKSNAFQSTALGNPTLPRIPMGTPFPLRQFKLIDGGLSMQTGGIRARFVIEKK